MLLIVLLVLLNPVDAFIQGLSDRSLPRRVLAAFDKRASWLVPLGLFALAAFGMLLVALRKRALALQFAAVVIPFCVLYGVIEFRRAYPNAAVFDLQRLTDGASILLGTDMRLSQFDPPPTLKVERKPVTRTAFPAIDIHFHFGSLPPEMTPERLVAAMDATGIRQVYNLDSGPGEFEKYASTFTAAYPDRLLQFAKPNFSVTRREGGVQQIVQWLSVTARLGARGVKVNKSLGLGVLNAEGKLLALDDPLLDPIWKEAGDLGMPVLMHTADPPAFFQPIDHDNERFEELTKFPEWSFLKPGLPSFETLMEQRERLLARNPGTIFIGAHIGSNEDDLAYAGQLLDRYPNYYIDMSSRLAGLGRQPRTAREFFIRYQDRILFGTDGGYALQVEGPWTAERYYRSYVEFLETANEYIEYPLWGINLQGKWHIQGIDLPAEVLEKIYFRNAERLLPAAEALRKKVAERHPELESGTAILPATAPP